MRNRAKCKLCKKILESFHEFDYVSCECGEISISGGQQKLEVFAKDFVNFLRIDDGDNEIGVIVKSSNEDAVPSYEGPKLSKAQMLEMLTEMRKSYENLPKNAMHTPITHCDLVSLMLLLEALLKELL
jgi:hypothetical protein